MADLPHYWGEAVQHLSRRDKVLAKIIAAYPEVKLRLKKDAFTTLARAIAGQQISVKAADTIWGRLVTAADGHTAKIRPQKIIATPVKKLRACGLSERKAEYIRDLAAHFAEKKISAAKLSRLADHEVKAELVALRGIGPWTADMYLMFNLWRPDVLPLGDVGLIRAVELNYFKGKKMPLKKIRAAAEPWSPFSTVATWYLWRSLDPIPVEY
ncbi:MAG: DNA-3-methyladenine glycosylase 2 family protein [Leptospiraceae bacterium]|nr:DNA-3-methyladenine glycosylase 2 family protein [Leptospiraceae bacterium]